MTPERLVKYERLYASPRYLGAGALLRRFLEIPKDSLLPLSIAHGVDHGHCHRPMDVDNIEPIHWSTNRILHEEAKEVKPSVLAPHPWAILAKERPPPSGRGVLVIGPPPSPENDRRLYDLIKDDIGEDWAVLVKPRGAFRGSIDFWQSKGLKGITADGPPEGFYERLYGIISTYRTVVGCTFSSAVILAASIGREIVMLRTYFCEFYELARYEDEINFASRRTSALVRCLANGDAAAKIRECRALLGFDFLDEPDRIRKDLSEEIHQIKRPFYKNPRNPVPYKLSEILAMRFAKPGILRYAPRDMLDRVRSKAICIVRMNDIDLWLSGKNDQNYRQLPVSDREGETVMPGFSPRGYRT